MTLKMTEQFYLWIKKKGKAKASAFQLGHQIPRQRTKHLIRTMGCKLVLTKTKLEVPWF